MGSQKLSGLTTVRLTDEIVVWPDVGRITMWRARNSLFL